MKNAKTRLFCMLLAMVAAVLLAQAKPFISQTFAYDGNEYDNVDYYAFEQSVGEKPESDKNSKIEVEGRSAYLMDYNTGTELFAFNEDARHPIASMVKIMTALLCFEDVQSGKLSLDDMITISPNAASMGGSQAFLDSGKVYDARTLVKSIIVASANDSCVAMAEHLSGSVEDFISRMNDKARSLNMNNTNFVNCTGLPAQGHYSSAKDVAIMTQALLGHAEYFDFSSIWMEDLVHEGGRVTGLTNTNKLLKAYKGCDGGKTGFTNEALFCMSATAKRGDMRLISVVMGSPDSKTRFGTCAKMMNYGFANYENKPILTKGGEADAPIAVTGGKQKTVLGVVADDFFVLRSRSDKSEISVEYRYFDVAAPVKMGDCIGKAMVNRDGAVVAEIDVVACSDVLQKTFMDILKDIKSNF